MKKALFGVSVLWFFLILACVILSSADGRKTDTCDKLATLSSADEVTDVDSQKSYALQFPVR